MNVKSIIDYLCVVISVYSAYKAWKYYDKVKFVYSFANKREANVKIMDVKDAISELLILANKENRVRGQNPVIRASELGKRMLDDIHYIQNSLPTDDLKTVEAALEKYALMSYINAVINGNAFKDGEIVIDREFENCQKCVDEIHGCIKQMLEREEKKIK